MSDRTPDDQTSGPPSRPRGTDGRSTQQIPRVDPESNGHTDSERFAKPATEKSASAKKTPASKSSTESTKADAEPTKGEAKSTEPTKTDAQDTGSGSRSERKVDSVAPGSKAVPTASEYAQTTSGSAATTAVMRAVTDAGQDQEGVDARASSPSRPSAAAATSAAASGAGRQAHLRLVHVEPWSITRLAFVVSVAMMIVAVVAVSIFWIVLDMTGVWDQINDSVSSVLSDNEGTFDITDYLGFGRLFGLTLVLSAVNVVLMTALATIGAHLYNLAAQLLGGVEVTFSDR